MTQKELLQKIKRHWASYVNSGGFSSPRMTVGRLQKGGIQHWSKFLQAGREYMAKYGEISLDFLPRPMLKLLSGE